MRSGVKGPSTHASARPTDQSFCSGEHFLSGAPRKREEKNPLGAHAALDQMGETVDEGPCLPGSCAGNDEERPVAECRRRRLFRIELRREIATSPLNGRSPLAVGLPLINPRFRHGAEYTRIVMVCRCFFGALEIIRAPVIPRLRSSRLRSE
jgi:hypothetical protein